MQRLFVTLHWYTLLYFDVLGVQIVQINYILLHPYQTQFGDMDVAII